MLDENGRHLPSPHGKAIGLELVEQRHGYATVTVPYNNNLVGDAETGVIHGGVLTTMLDNASGPNMVAEWPMSGPSCGNKILID